MIVDTAAFVDPDLVVDLAKELCRRPSMRPNELAVARYLADVLEPAGFDVELQEVVSDRPNVVAIARGAPDRQSFLFNGHSDMPPPVGGWPRDPFDPWIEDGVLYGGGLQDMKGGLAALVAGAIAAARIDPASRGDLIVLVSMHHDTIGLGTKYFLAANDWPIDAAVCGEPTNLSIQLFHGGAWGFEIRTRGIPRHQSRLEEGVDAIEGMLRVVGRLDASVFDYAPDPAHPFLPRFVVGAIQGGGHTSSTAEECVARGDVRFLPGMTIDQMRADLQRVVDDVCRGMAGLSGRVGTMVKQRPYEIDADAPVVRSLAAAHTRLAGAQPAATSGLPAGAFITDAADLVRAGIPTVLYGPADWRTQPPEGIPVADLVLAARVYAATAADVTAQTRRGEPTAR